MMHKRTIAPVLGLAMMLGACGGAETAPLSPAPQPADAAETGFPTSPPAPLPVSDVEFPEYAERTLRNGARLLVVENHEQPVVSVQLLLPGAGAAADDPALVGLASVTASLLDKGTDQMTAAEIAEAADFIGAQLYAGAANEWAAVGLTVITDFVDQGLALMSDVVMNPTFPDDELASEKTRRASALRLNRSQPGALASEMFTTEVYGAHPYGLVATAATIDAIEAHEVERFHLTRYAPEGALFVVAGDVDPDQVARKLELAFAGWEGTTPASGDRPAPPTRATRDLVFVHKPGSVQAVIRMGHLFPSATDADWPTLDVANQVLGAPAAAFQSWMMSTLREEKGFTYGARSLMNERIGPGMFYMTGEFRNEVADSALDIMFDLAERLRAGDIPAEDLSQAKNYLTGSFPLSIETPQQVASQVASNRLLGREDSYLEQYRGEVAAVTAAEAGAAAREQIHPDRMLIVVVGDATEVLDDIRRFADNVRVVDTEGRPMEAARLAAAPQMAFDASGLEPRTMTYGITFQGNEVGTATTTWSRDGADFVAVTEQAAPGATILQTTTFEAATFDPKSLVVSMGPMEMKLTVEDGRVTGQAIDMQTGQPGEVDMAFAPGTVLEGMVDVALAVHDFEDASEFTVRVLGGTGQLRGTAVTVAGTETVEVPAGSFETYRLEVSGEQAMTVWVTRDAPHVVVKRELAQQPIQIVLKSMQ